MLIVARGLWLIFAATALVLYLLSVPQQLFSYQTICPSGTVVCPSNQLSPAQALELQRSGISLSFYAHYLTAVISLFVAVFFVVAGIVFWRKSDEPMGLFAALVLVLFGVGFSSPFDTLAAAYPALQPLARAVAILSGVVMSAFLLLFPDGRLVPRWAVWFLPFIVFREAAATLFPSALTSTYLLFVELTLILAAIVYRYRRVSNPVQRQQTKWVVLGSVGALSGFVALVTVYGVLWQDSAVPGPLYLASITTLYGFILLIPVSITLAILRSHLWDIDIVIRRTLIYTVVMVVLALVYSASVILLEAVTRAITGESGLTFVTVTSTLAIAALFQPLRGRVRQAVDRRFFRSKYDTARVLSDFGVALRSEVDLNSLSDRLILVIQETMQPAHVSLTLTAPKRGGQRGE